MISGRFIRHTLFILCAVGRGCRAGWVRCVRWRSPRWLRLAACRVHLQFPGEVFCVCVCVCWGMRASGGGREGGREGSRWHVAEVVGGRVFPPGANQQCQTPPVHTQAHSSLSQACRGGSARRATSARPGPRVFVLVFSSKMFVSRRPN